jgi:hypothetical protein
MKRVKLVKAAKERANGGGNYFTNPKTKLKFISTGCKMFDLALGGGWAENRAKRCCASRPRLTSQSSTPRVASFTVRPRAHSTRPMPRRWAFRSIAWKGLRTIPSRR